MNASLAHLLLHSGERVVGSRQVASQVGKGLLHQALHLNPLIPGKLDEFLVHDPNSEIHLMRSLIPIQAISDLRLPIQAIARQKLKYLQMEENISLFSIKQWITVFLDFQHILSFRRAPSS
jgi:hypothetical protein